MDHAYIYPIMKKAKQRETEISMALTGPPAQYLKLIIGGLYLAPSLNAAVLIGPAAAPLGRDLTPNERADCADLLQVENTPICSSSKTTKAVVDAHLNRLAVGKFCNESPTILQLE